MLVYVGSQFYVGIPARDLEEDEIDELEGTVFAKWQKENPSLRRKRLRAFLINSGAYREANPVERHESKAERGSSENK